MALSVRSRSVSSSTSKSCASSMHCSKLDLRTYYGSSHFMKTIVPFALACVVTRRCIISAKYLQTHIIESVPYVGFRSTVKSGHCARFLHAAERKMQRAIRKKELKCIHLYIQHRASKEILEVFDFSIKYLASGDDDAEAMQPMDTFSFQVAADFFAKLNLISNENMYHEDDINLLFSLDFNKRISNTELAGFQSFDLSSFSSKLVNITSFSTRYHQLAVRQRLPKGSASSSSHTPRIEEAPMEVTEADGEDLEVIAAASSKASLPESYFNDFDEWFKPPERDEFNCLCAVSAPIHVEVIQCTKCKHYEHVACIGYMSKANVPDAETHCCVACRTEANQEWNDTLLKTRYSDNKRRRMICIGRLFIICYDNAEPLLDHLPLADKDAAANFLTKKRFLRSDGSKPPESVYSKLFYDSKPSEQQQCDSTITSMEN